MVYCAIECLGQIWGVYIATICYRCYGMLPLGMGAIGHYKMAMGAIGHHILLIWAIDTIYII